MCYWSASSRTERLKEVLFIEEGNNQPSCMTTMIALQSLRLHHPSRQLTLEAECDGVKAFFFAVECEMNVQKRASSFALHPLVFLDF